MTVEDEREAVLAKLEEALRAEDGDTKNFHIREAIQLLYINGTPVRAGSDRGDRAAE